MQTFSELMKAVLELLPTAELDTDNDGQIVIYTNLFQDNDGVLTDLPPDKTYPHPPDYSVNHIS